MKIVIARWESKRGKDWLEVVKDDLGYRYQSRGACGWLAAGNNAEAIAGVQPRVASGEFSSSQLLMKLPKKEEKVIA